MKLHNPTDTTNSLPASQLFQLAFISVDIAVTPTDRFVLLIRTIHRTFCTIHLVETKRNGHFVNMYPEKRKKIVQFSTIHTAFCTICISCLRQKGIGISRTHVPWRKRGELLCSCNNYSKKNHQKKMTGIWILVLVTQLLLCVGQEKLTKRNSRSHIIWICWLYERDGTFLKFIHNNFSDL